MQKVLAHQGDAPPDVRQFRPDVPIELAEILAAMLAKRPEDRFADPVALVSALSGRIEPLPLVGPQRTLPASWSRPRKGPSWWPRHAAWLVPSLLLALTVLALAIWWNASDTSPAFPELQIPGVPAAEK
jgi:hypothetical protein